LYKACIDLRIEEPNADLRQLGNIIYFVLRPLYAIAFAVVAIFALLAGVIKAKEVLDLKKKHRQKRPIVIEFSGSPKSGKTTIINSLELFLKRNGFRVAVVQERASVCPVADKKSPMFNIWTACTSITGMISHLVVERDDIDELKLRLDFEELMLNRGNSKSGSFQNVDSLIAKEGGTFESWSIEICKNILKPTMQMSLDV